MSSDNGYIIACTASIRQQAQQSLAEGMESLNQAKVGSALQVGCLGLGLGLGLCLGYF